MVDPALKPEQAGQWREDSEASLNTNTIYKYTNTLPT